MLNSLGLDTESVEKRLFSKDVGSPLTKKHSFASDVHLGCLPEALPSIPARFRSFDSQYARILFALYQQIEPAVNELKRVFGAERIAVVLGTSTSGVDASEAPFRERAEWGALPASYQFFNQEHGVGSEFIAELGALRGPRYSVSTACSSSAKVFGSARRLLATGVVDAVILGGADSICDLTVGGFGSLGLLSEGICRPMSVHRDGLNIGEGGALFVLTRSNSGVTVLGVGESSDAYHLSAPDPQGSGAKAAIEQSIAGLEDRKVAYVNLHGTGTILNDAMESKAVKDSLGTSTVCSSTKALTGHLLGGAGAVEVGFCWLMLKNESGKIVLPPHIWDGQRDPALPEIPLAERGEEMAFSSENVVLSNSFAFGGSNCCVALGL